MPDADGRIKGIAVPRLPKDMEQKRQTELRAWKEAQEAAMRRHLKQAEQA